MQNRFDVRKGLQFENLYRDFGGNLNGRIFMPASRVDLALWTNVDVFSYYISKDEKVPFRAKHATCNTGYLMVKHEIDRPQTQIVCNTCLGSWRVYELEKLPAKSFAERFEYCYSPKADEWPSVLAIKSNGVSLYTTVEIAIPVEAAEVFFKFFEGFRKNGFKLNSQ